MIVNSDFIKPIYHKEYRCGGNIFDGKQEDCIGGVGFFIDNYFITAAHVVENYPNAYIKTGDVDCMIPRENAIIWRSMPSKPIEEEYINPNKGDIAVFRFENYISPLTLSTQRPSFGDDLCCYHQVTGELQAGIVGSLYWPKLLSSNFFDWRVKSDNIQYGFGDSGSPLLKDNTVYGVLHGGAGNVCLFTSSSFVKKLIDSLGSVRL